MRWGEEWGWGRSGAGWEGASSLSETGLLFLLFVCLFFLGLYFPLELLDIGNWVFLFAAIERLNY